MQEHVFNFVSLQDDLEDEIVDEQNEENASPPVRKRRTARKAD